VTLGELTHDAVLGGRLRLWQPRRGFRFGMDAVLLAAACPAQPGQSVLELGCGVGTALLCLGKRVDGLALTGVEVQAGYADLARQNAAEAGIAARVVTADLADLPKDLRRESYDTVLMNPPYFEAHRSSASADDGRDLALRGETPLADWLMIGARRLAPGGRLTVIQRMERLPEVLGVLSERLGSLAVRPIANRIDAAPDRVLVEAVKGGRAAFHLSPPLEVFGPKAGPDGKSYGSEITAVLRTAAPIALRC